ncbi:MAG: hypothetical protein AAFV77_03730 [Planctomycetota bacterium]
MPRRPALEAGIDRRLVRAHTKPQRRVESCRCLVMFATITIFVFFMNTTKGVMPDIHRWVLGGGAMMAALALGMGVLHARALRYQRAASFALGLCPGCGYSIAELQPEADGCRVCPECGAAWRLGDLLGSTQRGGPTS